MYIYQSQKKMSFLDMVWRYKFHLAAYIMVISCVSYAGLYLFGGIPNELKTEETVSTLATTQQVSAQTIAKIPPKVRSGGVEHFIVESTTASASTHVSAGSQSTSESNLPVRIIIDKVGINTAINNPISTNTATLDNALLKGAVRYPGSGTLGKGNMFVFAHSTSIKIVNNQAYKAFNNLKNLSAGDTIRVQSQTKAYIYTVTSVKMADSDDVIVDIKASKNMLTLSTCNVLGEKQQRYVVEAEYVNSLDL